MPAVAEKTEIDAVPAAPRWRLDDLYASPESSAFAADMKKAREEAKAFGEAYRGKLQVLLEGVHPEASLGEAVRRYEDLQDLGGRLMSYASLLHAGDTSDAKIAKVYGDTIEAITSISSDLVFFELELNRLDDAKLTAAAGHAPLAHYAPWLEDIRRDRPHQLRDEIEQLFLEKSTTGAAAWNRLFDETIAGLRFTVDGQELSLEPLLSLFQDRREERRRAAGEALGETLGQKLPLFSLITNTLAKDKDISDRWRHFEDCADSRHLANRVEPATVAALVEAVQASYPYAVAPLLQAEGEVVRQGRARLLGPQRAVARSAAQPVHVGRGQGDRAVGLSRFFAKDARTSPSAFSPTAGSTARPVPARRPAPLPIR